VQLYLLEGLTRATSDTGISQILATGETVLAAILFVSIVLFIRATRVPEMKKAAQEN